ncbi:hypothetical protein P4O66_008002 [Electrophorus voltai]|uniref:ribonuclease H n=1 Tax=Electrophorus voltai TaxID=2609070 RepID=A0AAD8ZEL2_9TELE|nr:hypothetical protein P4O66_008002 [Electrophorus voltai]
MDLRSTYNLIRVREGDEWKTAFSTSTSHYEYLVLPYGLATAPSVFQAYINKVLREYLGRSVITYIDDILIYSSSKKKHLQDVRAVLQTLLKNHLYCKAEKCEFHCGEVDFLVYVIQEGSVHMQPGKIEAVKDWLRPRTSKVLQRFLGFTNFYRRFIKKFTSIPKPLTDQLRGPARQVRWTSEMERSFKGLKGAFITAPVLQQPDPEKPVMVEVDASDSVVGVVLSQHTAQWNGTMMWGTMNCWPCSLLASFEEWRHWLEGAQHPFTVYTDYKNLEYLHTAKRLNARQARWSLFFTRFKLHLIYRPGERNTRADALSR